MKKLLFLVYLVSGINLSHAENCQTDAIGNIYCAPSNGTAIKDTLGEIVCAPGQCVNKIEGGHLCSNQQGGSVVIDQLSQIKCYGTCIEPTHRICQKM